MNDDIERWLRQVTPRGAPPELRPQLLSAVADELNSVTRSHRPRPGLVVAAAVLASLALNYWVRGTIDRRLAVVLGPPPVDRQAAEIATDIASITDLPTGQWAYERLASVRPRGDDVRQYAARLQRLIQQFTLTLKETADETPQNNSQMDRNIRGSRDRYPTDAQCVLRLEHRNTA